ncbi:MAG: monovalent cation/H+ antiporter subunit D family protein, partial [Candidatus Dadabacteria bacterium]
MKSSALPVLIVIIPLLAAFTASICSLFKAGFVYYIAFAGTALGSILSVFLATSVITFGPVSYQMGGWPAPIGIVYEVDSLNALFIILVQFVSL